ncbi:MAG: transglycosylase domain-containing protein, partial [Deltaproteobacteria bacterium]|nr:transglycosylase domain-containing protein [Deltaproteobacteria bacterium]
MALLALLLTAAFYSLIAVATFSLRFVNPPTTAVQMERRVHALVSRTPYTKRYHFVPLSRISLELQRAVIAAEDAGFYRNYGIAWHDLGHAISEDIADRRNLGASTIEQQLARNLFLSTNRSILRKAIEFSIVPFI